MRIEKILRTDAVPTQQKWETGWLSFLAIGLSFLLMGCSYSPEAATPSNATNLPTEKRDNDTATNLSSQETRGQMLPIEAKITVGSEEILLEVARTQQQQSLGLMHRSSLDKNRGMLFPFSPPRPVGFWMKNVQIHLDMIFLKEGQVAAVASNVPPCNTDPCPSYGAPQPIDQVIELRGGRAAELGIERGDRILVQFLDSSPSKN